ncbi:MAG: methyltransferase domain-containing protein [Candidatus Binataceae bacterium]|jgi:SAM-dependent methyltransferase
MSNQGTDPELLKDRQRRDWDAAASGWDKWWPHFERAAQHVSDRLVDLAHVREGHRVLDIATGNGEPALTAARRTGPHGLVVATDQSDGMLAIARARASSLGITNLEFIQADGEKLDLGERDFDAALCRWGLMFMPNVVGALKGLHARMVAGGWFATAVWSSADKVPMITLGAQVVRQLVQLPPPLPDALEPLRLADPSRLAAALREARFTDLIIERIPVVFEFATAAAFTQFRYEISAAFRTMLNSQTPELRQQILDAITSAASAYADASGKVRTVNETIVFAARRE